MEEAIEVVDGSQRQLDRVGFTFSNRLEVGLVVADGIVTRIGVLQRIAVLGGRFLQISAVLTHLHLIGAARVFRKWLSGQQGLVVNENSSPMGSGIRHD